MNDDRVVRLLEEIRDLQRQHGAWHQQALRNQEEAIRAQQVAVARGRTLQVGLGVVIAVVLVVVLFLLRYVLQRFT